MISELSISAHAMLLQLANQTKAFRVLNVEPLAIQDAQHGRRAGDFQAQIQPAGSETPLDLVIEVKARLLPGEALGAMHRLQGWSPQVLPVICCPFMSPRTAEILAEANIGYLDAAGNCRLSAPGFFLFITGKPNPTPDGRPMANIFAPRSSQISHVMLLDPGRPWFVQELARAAGVSIGLASRVKQRLIEEGFVEEMARTVRIRDPEALLKAWRREYKPQVEKTSLYMMASAEEAENRVAQWCRQNGRRYMLAEFSGAWRLAPMVRYNQASIYILDSGDKPVTPQLMLDVEAKPAQTGANLSVGLTKSEGMFLGSKEIGGLNVASPVQIYLDLIDRGGRGEEAAIAIYEKAISAHINSAIP